MGDSYDANATCIRIIDKKFYCRSGRTRSLLKRMRMLNFILKDPDFHKKTLKNYFPRDNKKKYLFYFGKVSISHLHECSDARGLCKYDYESDFSDDIGIFESNGRAIVSENNQNSHLINTGNF
jgi:hypothetical protein